MSVKCRKKSNVVECCAEYLYCLYNPIWMLYGVCFHVIELICKCVLDVGDTCWRLWGTRVMVWERGVVCPKVLSCSCSCQNEGTCLIKFIWIVTLVDKSLESASKTSNSIHISRDLGHCRVEVSVWTLRDEDGRVSTLSVAISDMTCGSTRLFAECDGFLKHNLNYR